MRKKTTDKKVNCSLILLLILSVMSCIISGITRYLFPYHMSSKWTESIVGLGMSGGLFWGGMLIMLLAIEGLRYSKTIKFHQKLFTLLAGVIMMVLGLLFVFSIVLDLVGLPEIVL